jgi:hypothetical protein
MKIAITTTAAALLILAAGLPTATWAANRAKPSAGYSAALPGGSTAVAPWSGKWEAALPGGANEGASTGESGQGGAWYSDNDNDQQRHRATRRNRANK